MEIVWIIGAGRFGTSALNRLSHQHQNWQFVLVDIAQEKLLWAKGTGFAIEHCDGIEFLTNCLGPGTRVSWIIPSLPLHLAWEWCAEKMGPDRLVKKQLPFGIDLFLPNPMHGANNDIYVSNADFICPENCPEPEHVCTFTKQPRKQDMATRLETLEYMQYSPIVLASRQLAPGVGGYRPSQMFSFLKKIEEQKNRHLLVCTACRCHGVITGAEKI